MNEYTTANRQWWDEAVGIHTKSEFYELEAFKAGKSKLNRLDHEEVGDVTGKSLLHLQCHFGMDALSWARLGATVTGADFSEKAIETARALSNELGINATFVQSDIYKLPEVLPPTDQFDIVYTSYGVICWLPDLMPWGKMIASYLKPGGFFYIAEGHSFMWAIDEKSPGLNIHYPYFSHEPIKSDEQGSYADRNAQMEHTVTYGWNHTVSEILTSLLSPGLRIDFFHEHPFCVWNCLPAEGMVEDENGFWWLKDEAKRDMLPLMFSLKATKPLGNKSDMYRMGEGVE